MPRVHLPDFDRLAPDDQKVSLWCMNRFIQINAKSKKNVVGIERLSIGELQPASKFNRILQSILRNLAAFGEAGLRKLRSAIDVDQIRLHHSNHFARRRIRRNQRVQRFRFSSQREYESPAALANRIMTDQILGFRNLLALRLRHYGRRQMAEADQSHSQPQRSSNRVNTLRGHMARPMDLLPTVLSWPRVVLPATHSIGPGSRRRTAPSQARASTSTSKTTAHCIAAGCSADFPNSAPVPEFPIRETRA